jgi:hypothetical protein
MNPVSVPGGNFQEISLTMKKLIATLTSSPLSAKIQNSRLDDFAIRLALSIVGIPLGGYLLGLLINYWWPGEIPWATSLALLSLVLGCMHIWYWGKQA